MIGQAGTAKFPDAKSNSLSPGNDPYNNNSPMKRNVYGHHRQGNLKPPLQNHNSLSPGRIIVQEVSSTED